MPIVKFDTLKKYEKSYFCLITGELMESPVFFRGHNYSQQGITAWLENHKTDPSTEEPLLPAEYSDLQLQKNTDLHDCVADFLEEYCSKQDFFAALLRGELEAIEPLKCLDNYHLITKNKDGLTALHVAVNTGNCEIVDYLLKNGANPLLPDDKDETPRALAIRLGKFDLTSLMSGGGLKINRPRVDTTENGILQTPPQTSPQTSSQSMPAQAEPLPLPLTERSSLQETNSSLVVELELSSQLLQPQPEESVQEVSSSQPPLPQREPLPPPADNASLDQSRELINAVSTGNLEALQALMKCMTNILSTFVNKKNKDTLLHVAVAKGYVEIVKVLVTQGKVDALQKNGQGFNAFHMAAQCGSINIIEFLLQRESTLLESLVNETRQTALHLATEVKNNEKVVICLLKRKMNVLAQDSKGNTPLHTALLRDEVNLPAIEALLGEGACWEVENNTKWTPKAIFFKKHVQSAINKQDGLHLLNLIMLLPIKKAAKIVAQVGNKVNVERIDITALLVFAVEKGESKIIETLFRQNIFPLDFKHRVTIFHLTAAHGQPKIADLVLDCSERWAAILTSKDENERTALSIAAGRGHLSMVEFLLREKEIGLEMVDSNGCTALCHALTNKQIAVAQLLAKKGARWDRIATCSSKLTTLTKLWLNNCLWPAVMSANPEEVSLLLALTDFETTLLQLYSHQKNALLLYAAEKGFASIVAILLDYTEDLQLTGASGFNALHLAADYGHAQVVTCLLDYLIKNPKMRGLIEGKSSHGDSTALHCAVYKKHSDIVKLLLTAGANSNAKNGEGNTPLHIALLRDCTEIAEYLINADVDTKVVNQAGETVLQLAKAKNLTSITQLIIQKTPVPPVKNRTPPIVVHKQNKKSNDNGHLKTKQPDPIPSPANHVLVKNEKKKKKKSKVSSSSYATAINSLATVENSFDTNNDNVASALAFEVVYENASVLMKNNNYVAARAEFKAAHTLIEKVMPHRLPVVFKEQDISLALRKIDCEIKLWQCGFRLVTEQNSMRKAKSDYYKNILAASKRTETYLRNLPGGSVLGQSGNAKRVGSTRAQQTEVTQEHRTAMQESFAALQALINACQQEIKALSAITLKKDQVIVTTQNAHDLLQELTTSSCQGQVLLRSRMFLGAKVIFEQARDTVREHKDQLRVFPKFYLQAIMLEMGFYTQIGECIAGEYKNYDEAIRVTNEGIALVNQELEKPSSQDKSEDSLRQVIKMAERMIESYNALKKSSSLLDSVVTPSELPESSKVGFFSKNNKEEEAFGGSQNNEPHGG